MLNAERSSGGEGVEGKINGGGAMRVPTAPLPTVRPGLVLLRYNRDLPTVQELEHEQEHLVPDRVHRNDLLRVGPSRGAGPRASHPERVEARLRLRAAEELPEEEAPGGEDAAVGVDETALDAEGDIAEGLAVDEEVEVVEGERS